MNQPTYPNASRTTKTEYPRPDFQRGTSEGIDWINLNGPWHFAFDPGDTGEQAHWFAPDNFPDTPLQIQVPYPWESLAAWGQEETADNATYLSPNAYLHPEHVTCGGLEREGNYRDAPRQTIGWYRKTVSVPETWHPQPIILHFGAVDWHAKVWVNGHYLGEHQNGYLPFEFDITDALTPGEPADIVVRAYDAQEHGEQIVGKQANWYTRTSGIWQTVYLEPRNATHLQQCHITPDIDASTATFAVNIARADEHHKLRWHCDGMQGEIPAAETTHFTVRILSERLRLWDVDTPNLYPVTLELLRDDTVVDTVYTYFGMRKVSVEKAPGGDYQYIYLNNRPVYLLGALNQSFTPEGVYTYLTDEHLRTDIARAKDFGFNFLRLHIKVDEPRLYYWADKLGILFMCDIPNFSTYTPTAQANLEETLRRTIARDYNHPSIISWCVFNETWGLGGREFKNLPERQEWVRDMYHLAKSLDTTRLVEDNSPCLFDHVETDINSWHFYINHYARAKEHIANVVQQTYPGSPFNYAGEHVQAHAPLINSEYGGISAGAGDKDISWSFKYLTNELRLHPKIGGYVYTELQDIEWEHNGFMNYDRTVKDFGYDVRHINALDFIGIDSPPGTTVAPGDKIAMDIYASHFSHKTLAETQLHWRLDALDALGRLTRGVVSGTPVPIPFPPYQVEKVHRLELEIPDIDTAVGTLHVWVEDKNRAVIARNFINLEIVKPTPAHQERHRIIAQYLPEISKSAQQSTTSIAGYAENRSSTNQPIRTPREQQKTLARWMDASGASGAAVLVRYHPGDIAQMHWEVSEPIVTQQRFAAQGTGYTEYLLTLPPEDEHELARLPKKAEQLALVFEASAFNGGARQTEPEKFPTTVTISINGVEIQTVTLPDCPADARGVLSHLHDEPGTYAGTYGYLTRLTVEGQQLEQVRAQSTETFTIRYEVTSDAEHRGGFALYGSRRGRYPTAPHLLFSSSL